MTITEAIEKLTHVHRRYGDVEVFFDCPFCLKSFAPNTLKAMAVHLTNEQEPEPPQEGR